MDRIKALADRARTVQDSMNRWIRQSLEYNSGEVMERQYAQLAGGKASGGQDLRPYYSEDKYFRTKAEMESYRNYKWSINNRLWVQPDRPRNPDAPNLFINGKFWSELDAFFTDEAMTIDGKTSYAKDIVNKYGLSSFGLDAYNRAFMADNVVRPYLIMRLRETLL